ncbi:hypothetical protein ABMA27_004190 [Loxostege sticticalis]|uniref:Uncharacterized protein n=1 Tax=Loxostege sticticalis TaxID=481309 RepID=A0ABR3HMP2_LOXSC
MRLQCLSVCPSVRPSVCDHAVSHEPFALGSYSALRVQYNNTFRALLRLPRYCSASGMFADAAVDDFYAIMRKKVTSLVRRVMGSGNQVLKMIADRMDAAVFRRYTELHVLHAAR